MAANGIARIIASNFSSAAEVRAALSKKLLESTLDLKDARLLRMEPYTAQQVATSLRELPIYRAGFRIPYFNLAGKVTQFYRFRYLEYNNGNGFAALATQNLKHALRYAQPGNTINELYLSPAIKWPIIAQDINQRIIITEGELKAACGCKHGLPTIGLGGVWNFKSAKLAQPLLPGFQLITWKDRIVYLCYDSDAVSNPDVCRAENALARELLSLGAIPHVCRIPALAPPSKTGMDDFIAARGADAFMKEVLETADAWAAAEALYQLNEVVLYVKNPGLILEVQTGQRMGYRNFVDHIYAQHVYYEQQVTASGTKTTEKSAAKEWIKWAHRAQVERVTYAPGEEKIITLEGARTYNTWPGWKVAPVKGNVGPWVDLLDYLFVEAPEQRKWFEQWLAYPLQNPGAKLYTASVLWGIEHGTGKSLVGYTMGCIYGDNFTEITERELYSSFNDWAESKQFIMGEEITSSENRRAVADRLKSMITQRNLRLNPKYIPAYTVPDRVNYYFTSNHPDSFQLEDRDRRFFVHEVAGKPMPQKFYEGYMHWLEQAGGAAALFYHLLHLDLTGFHPHAAAPVTAAKTEMIDNTRSDLSAWVARLKEDREGVLQVAGLKVERRLWTATELRQLYDPQDQTRVTVNGLSRELRRAGFRKANGGVAIKTRTRGVQKIWVIDQDFYEQVKRLKPAAVADYFDKERDHKGPNGEKY